MSVILKRTHKLIDIVAKMDHSLFSAWERCICLWAVARAAGALVSDGEERARLDSDTELVRFAPPCPPDHTSRTIMCVFTGSKDLA